MENLNHEQLKKPKKRFMIRRRSLKEGSREVWKFRNDPSLCLILASFCCVYRKIDCLLAFSRQFEFRERSPKLTGVMSTKKESKQSTPSVIARLMGLDELPPQQPLPKQQRVLSENYLRRVASIGVWEKSFSHERSSFRLSVEEQEEFKDIFAELETLKKDKHRKLSVEKRKANPSSSELEMEFISQKVIDADSFSVDVKLQTLKEAHDAPIVMNSEKELFRNYLQKPGSLIPKHLHDLQGIPPHVQSRHTPVLKSSGSTEYGKTNICRKSGRRIDQGNVKLLQKAENGLVKGSHGKSNSDIICHFLRNRLDSKNGACHAKTRIVVLKPNHGKAENSSSCFASPNAYEDSHSGARKHIERVSLENESSYAEVKERKNFADDTELIRRREGVSSEIAEDIARQTRHGMSGVSKETSGSESRGGETLEKESKKIIASSPNFSDLKSRHHSSFYHSDWWHVARESKKQISERLKLTKKFQEVGLPRGSRCSNRTLGEMLGMPDNDSGPRDLDYKLDEHGLSNDGLVNSGSPLCISSKDGWKDIFDWDLPTSRSPPTYSTVIVSPKTRTSQRTAKTIESVVWAQQKSRKLDLGQRDGSEPRNSALSCKKSQSVSQLESENNHSVEDNHVLQNEPKNKLEEEDPSGQNSVISIFSSHGQKKKLEGSVLSEQNFMVHRSSISSLASVSLAADIVAGAESEVMGRSFGNHKQQQFGSTDSILLVKDDNSPSYVPEVSSRQDTLIGISEEGSVSSNCYGTDPESHMKLEEGDQPSPASILEPPFEEEISEGPECFQSVNLYRLQQQLEILKSESFEEYSEGSGMIMSSEEDSDEGSVGDSEIKGDEDVIRLFRVEESRDFSYIVDVLTEAGFQGRNQGFDAGHSSECPISPMIFEKLEKKYGEQTSWKRSERRLLFDRVNSGLIENLQPCIGVCTWVKPVSRRLSFRQGLEVVEELSMLLISQEKQAKDNSSVNVLGKDDRWLELEDDIEIIGREIENLLIDELAAEVVSM